MKKRIRNYSPKTNDALFLIGNLIKMNRKLKKMPELELAERVGVSRSTIQRMETGDAKCEIGLMFEAAHIVGIDLFHDNTDIKNIYKNTVTDALTLLPKRIRKHNVEVDNDF